MKKPRRETAKRQERNRLRNLRARETGCTAKVRYASKDVAMVFAAPFRFHVYPCHFCKGWHIAKHR
jgi:hypothetical protein